jgi:hypothetical protein
LARIPGMRAGTVYILRNAAFRDSLIKIGKTTRSSAERAKELSRVTGVPDPFEVLYHEDVDDVDLAEQLVHERLKDCRLASNREFFQLPLPNAVRVVLETCLKVNEASAANARALVLWMGGDPDASRLKAFLSRHGGGTTYVVLAYRNSHGECMIRLPESVRIRFTPRLIPELRAEFPDMREIELGRNEGSKITWSKPAP